MLRTLRSFALVAGACCLAGAPALAASPSAGTTPLEIDGLTFGSWSDVVDSEYFKAAGLRCGTPSLEQRELQFGFDSRKSVPADCSSSSTNPTSDYDPDVLYRIPVVFHVIADSNCADGNISDEAVISQIEILNEDFKALLGSNGENGFDSQIEFYLATTDPQGQPTTGITRSCNTTWFNDGGGYFNTLAWDPFNYMNIYSNTAGGNLGYVPFLPADGGGNFVGGNSDRVVLLWNSVGRDAPFFPYHQGRTGTHEVGHYLGLEHVFSGGCGSAVDCYTTGDLLCDTRTQTSPNFGCPANPTSCGTADNPQNYMDYTDDLCMAEFTSEQSRRMRCSLESFRMDLYELQLADIFSDGFEDGTADAWTSSL